MTWLKLKEWERAPRASDGLLIAKTFRDLSTAKQDKLLARLDLPERMTLVYWLAVTQPFQEESV